MIQRTLTNPLSILFLIAVFSILLCPDAAHAQWVYVDHSGSGGSGDFLINGFFYGNNLSGSLSSSDGSFLNDQILTITPLGFSFHDLTLGGSPLPPPPSGFGNGVYSQAQMDAAVQAATSLSTPMSFAQGGEIAAAVASACLVAVSLGLVRKAMV